MLLQNDPLIEKLARKNLERIPERVAHAKGLGMPRTFAVTQDITC